MLSFLEQNLEKSQIFPPKSEDRLLTPVNSFNNPFKSVGPPLAIAEESPSPSLSINRLVEASPLIPATLGPASDSIRADFFPLSFLGIAGGGGGGIGIGEIDLTRITGFSSGTN